MRLLENDILIHCCASLFGKQVGNDNETKLDTEEDNSEGQEVNQEQVILKKATAGEIGKEDVNNTVYYAKATECYLE